MSKQKGKYFLMKLDTYPFTILVSVGQSDAEFHRAIKRNYSSKMTESFNDDDRILSMDNNNQVGSAMITEHNHTLIRLKHYPTTPEYHAAIAHESFHMAHFILERVGIELTQATKEAYAYLIDAIVQRIYRECKNSKP